LFHRYEGGHAEDFFDRVSTIALPSTAVAGECDPLAATSRSRRDVAGVIERQPLGRCNVGT
jgi:hypothetical protein